MTSPTKHPMLHGDSQSVNSNYNSTEDDFLEGSTEPMVEEDPLNSSGNSDDYSHLLKTSRNGQSGSLVDPIPDSISREIELINSQKVIEDEKGTTGKKDMEKSKNGTTSHVLSRSMSQAEQHSNPPKNKNVLERQYSLGNSYITRNTPAPVHDETDGTRHHEVQPAVLEVQQTIEDRSNMQEKNIHELIKDSGSERLSLQSHGETLCDKSKHSLSDKKRGLKKQAKLHTPLRATMSMSDKSDMLAHRSINNSKLSKQEQRSSSLEVPSIRVRYEDELSTSSDPSANETGEVDDDNFLHNHNSYVNGFSNYHTNCDRPMSLDKSSPNPLRDRQSLPLNYAQRQILSKTVGRSAGNKLIGTCSLDVPDQHSLHPSHSLGTMPQIKDEQNLEFQKVEDKLISSSLSRLEANQRRRSWAPDTSPRGSKGYIFDKDIIGDGKFNWLNRKGQSVSEHHTSTPTLEALVSSINMSTSYERFGQNGSQIVNEGQKEGGSNGSPERSADVSDVQIGVEDGASVTIYNENDKTKSAEYIDDPAGDPFAPKNNLERLQHQVRNIIENFFFRVFTVLIIALDFILVIVDLAKYDCATSNNPIEIISHIIIVYFVIEIGARIFYQGKLFFFNWLDLLDMAVVFISFIIDVVFMAMYAENDCERDSRYAKLVVIGRIVRIIRAVRIVYIIIVQHRQVARATRQMVSQNKRRYQKDGFDLDLCYITERVIAMSFPSKGMMALYRNPVAEVARFFNTKHGGHYRIYNLCSERDYDETLFFNNVERVYIDDHNVPKLREMLDFTANARQWMAADKQNTIAIHCKGGKGRTGTMICTWLIDCGLLESASESLEYFGDRRTDLSKGSTFQGVETPSQSRYVGYYEKLKNSFNRQLPPKKILKLVSIKIHAIGAVGNGDGSEFYMELRQDNLPIFECNLGTQANCEVLKYEDDDSIVISLFNCPNIHGDIKIMFKSDSKKLPIGYDKCPFYFWFYTSFVDDNCLIIPREELDNPHKKKTHHVFTENFSVQLNFDDVNDY